ncbi:MAG: hypothetical protein KJ063_07670 [Anaerolineae bacterium]|nr:hypothetical protein [Anaerolineae bacterium]
MHKPNTTRQRKPMPGTVGRSQMRIQPPQPLTPLHNQVQNGSRPPKNKKHKRR